MLLTESHHGGDESAVVLHSLVSASSWLLLLVLLGHPRSFSSHFAYTRKIFVNLTHFDELMLLSLIPSTATATSKIPLHPSSYILVSSLSLGTLLCVLCCFRTEVVLFCSFLFFLFYSIKKKCMLCLCIGGFNMHWCFLCRLRCVLRVINSRWVLGILVVGCRESNYNLS